MEEGAKLYPKMSAVVELKKAANQFPY